MSERGYHHPERGYWQTISEPDAATLAAYPAGTVEVPLKPGAGFTWTGSAWAAPVLVAPVAPPAPSRLTPLEFIERFTPEEQLAIVTASMQVPVLKLWYDKLLSAGDVVQADPRLIDGMAALVAAGLITSDRSAEVLAWL